MSTYEKIADHYRKEGFEIGLEKVKTEVIHRGLKNGFSLKDLAILTGLTENRVTDIINSEVGNLNN